MILAAAFCLSCLTFTVGPVVVDVHKADCAGGTETQINDGPVSMLRTGCDYAGYQASQQTRRFTSPVLATLFAAQPGVVALPRGAAGSYDETGAWIESAEVVNGTVKVWYHGESHSRYACNGHTVKTLAYAESKDGLTFTKKGQIASINNGQVCQWPCSPGCNQWGVGDGQIVRFGINYFLYPGTTDNSGSGIYSTPISGHGGPGTWYRWGTERWTKAMGGAGSPLVDTQGTWLPNASPAVYDPAQHVMLFGILNDQLWMWASADGVHDWTRYPKPIMDMPQDWLNFSFPRKKAHNAYFTIYSEETNSNHFVSTFNLYWARNPVNGKECESERVHATITLSQGG